MAAFCMENILSDKILDSVLDIAKLHFVIYRCTNSTKLCFVRNAKHSLALQSSALHAQLLVVQAQELDKKRLKGKKISVVILFAKKNCLANISFANKVL